MSSIVRTTRASRAHVDTPAKSPREKALLQLDRAIARLGDDAKHEVKLARPRYGMVTLPGRRSAPEHSLASDERSAARNFQSVVIDRKNETFYFQRFGDDHGPFALPRGFQYADLFDSGHVDPRPRTAGQKALAKLSKQLRAEQPELFGREYVQMRWDLDGATWRTAAGGKLHKVEVRDERFEWGKSSFMFDLRKREVWIEQIPGVSGEAWGPFTLPEGFAKADLDALATVDTSERPARTRPSRDDYERSPGHNVYAGGRDSDAGYVGPRLRDVIGGGGSGGSASSVYWRNRGGGGSGS